MLDKLLRGRVEFELTQCSLCDGRESHIVISWSKSTAGKNQFGAACKRSVDIISYRIDLIARRRDMPNSSSHSSNHPAQVIRIRVLHQPQQYFVADGQYFDVDHDEDYTQQSEVRSPRSEVRSPDFGLRTSDFELWASNFGL